MNRFFSLGASVLLGFFACGCGRSLEGAPCPCAEGNECCSDRTCHATDDCPNGPYVQGEGGTSGSTADGSAGSAGDRAGNGGSGSTNGSAGDASGAGTPSSGAGGGALSGGGGSSGDGGAKSPADGVTLPEYCSSNGWCGALVSYTAVWGSAANDLWILAGRVPESVGTSALLHFDGTAWQRFWVKDIDPTLTYYGIAAIWGAAPDDVWVGGSSATLAHFDGSRWTKHQVSTTGVDAGGGALIISPDIYAISGVAPDDVWAVGWYGGAVHWDGTAWTGIPTPVSENLRGVWASGPDDAWAVGDAGNIIHWDGEAWSRYEDAFGGSATNEDLAAIWGAASDDVWAVGANATVLRWDGSRWQSVGNAARTGENLRSVWGSDSDNVWVVGDAGRLGHWDGEAWYEAPAQAAAALSGVWGSAGETLWAVGEAGTIVHFDSATWTQPEKRLPIDFRAIWGAAEDDIWAIGSDGASAHFDGKRWSQGAQNYQLVTDRAFMFGTGANDRWLVYDHTVTHDEGSGLWGGNYFPTAMHEVWGTGPSDAWVVGDAAEGENGALFHWDGALFTPVDSGTPSNLLSIWGAASDDIWVATSGSEVLHYDGTTWSSRQVAANGTDPVSTSWERITGAAGDDVWLLGGFSWSSYKAGGFARAGVHWDGSAWSQPATTPYVDGVRATLSLGHGDLYAVTSSGAGGIVHFDGSTWQTDLSGVDTWLVDVSVPAEGLYGIWASDREIWAVGSNGMILHKSR